MPNKSDFSLKLIEEGHARVNLIGSQQPANASQLETAEEVAKKKELGIWSASLKLVTDTKQQTWDKFSFLEQVTVEVTNVIDGREFYVRVLDKDADYAKIEKILKQFDSAKAEELQKPVLKGTLCAAKAKDGKWRRARVLQSLGKGQSQVMFMDYGHIDNVDISNMRKLPQDLLKFEPQARECTLAYVKVPRREAECGDKARKYLCKHALDKVQDAIIVEERRNLLKVILVDEGETDWNESINAFMLAEGIALLDRN
jgi:staphylococcal nuclease domain-containing protein 1